MCQKPVDRITIFDDVVSLALRVEARCHGQIDYIEISERETERLGPYLHIHMFHPTLEELENHYNESL
jgi:hypothetical protein